MFDCPGCAQRREAMRTFGKRMADWMKRPTTTPPEIVPVEPSKLDAVQAESLARIRALAVKRKS